MTPEERTHYRGLALRHVTKLLDVTNLHEQPAVLSALVAAAVNALMLLDPDEAEDAASMAIRHARLNAAFNNSTMPIEMDEVIGAYCRRHRVAEEDLLGHKRAGGLWELRLGLYLELDNTRNAAGHKRWTREQIGARLGRDHSTITQGIQAALRKAAA